MITNEELISTSEYWTTRIQLDLFNHILNYMQENGMNRAQLAQKLGVTKGYVTQVLNGDFDHRLSKLVELSLAIGLIPKLEFLPKADFFEERNTISSPFEKIERIAPIKPTLKFSKPYQGEIQIGIDKFYTEKTKVNNKFRIAS